MFDDLLKELFLFLPILMLTQVVALAAAVGIWSVGTLAGLAMVFTVLWKMFAVLALVVAVLALGQVKAKGLDKPPR